MIWLASFPRSGNTFFRNVLYEVYGLESSTWHREPQYPLDPAYDRYPVVKTHLLPDQLVPSDPSIPKVYIIREGRDALVSMAHHRKDIIEPGSDYYLNLLEAILAMDGSFFGGWSENVRQWTKAADVIIRFEDLIADPIREVEKLRAVMDLPPPRKEKLPSFADLKFGTPQYGAGRKILDDQEVADMARKNFRRGKTGAWKDEMPPELERLFWELHGEQMLALGYELGPIGESWLRERQEASGEPYRILIEGNKTEDAHMDGIRRYVEELMYSLVAFQRRQPEKWRIDVLTHGQITPLPQYYHRIEERRELERQQFGIRQPIHKDWEHYLLSFKMRIRQILPTAVYDRLSPVYRALPIRRILAWIRGESIQERYVRAWRQASAHHELVHVPLPQNYLYVEQMTLPSVFTVHDMTHQLFPEYHEPGNVHLAAKGMTFLREHAAAVIAVSSSTRRDLLDQFPELEARTTVIHEAANGDRFKPMSGDETWRLVRERYQIPDQPYFISLSTLEPRKNLRHVVEAFLRFSSRQEREGPLLLICGRKGWRTEEVFSAGQAGSERIHFTGHVLDEDLPWLYSRALAMCYVAHYEGFGLPPLEAMRCGTPVIYGNNSALPEVVGEAGLAADSRDVEDIQKQMERLWQDAGLRNDLARKAVWQSRRFSWLRTAFDTLRVYESVIRRQRDPAPHPVTDTGTQTLHPS
ncbi:MAG: glycosyltransferase [Saprospiraceae bacterium]|nr:glycosyltransferase [Saprospiraceae bacterium]